MGGYVPPEIGKIIAEYAGRRPKDMTEAELAALPVGPTVRRERPVTDEDRARGVHGRVIVWEEHRPVRATVWTSNDIFAWRDADGVPWDFGQWADGSWFRQPSVFA